MPKRKGPHFQQTTVDIMSSTHLGDTSSKSDSADALNDQQFELDPSFHVESSDDDADAIGASAEYIGNSDKYTTAESDQSGGTGLHALESLASKKPPQGTKNGVEPGPNLPRKRARTKQTNKPQTAAVEDQSQGWNLSPSATSNRLSQALKRALPQLSSLEVDELNVKDSQILDSSLVAQRKSLLSFIREGVPALPATLAKPTKLCASPRIIVVAGAALRVADLCRELRPYKSKETEIAKLFARHFKLSEHVDYLKKTKISIAVGTPNRLAKLLDEPEALNLNQLSHLILDCTHVDAKQRSLIDLPEARADLFQSVLGHPAIKQRLRLGRLRVVCF